MQINFSIPIKYIFKFSFELVLTSTNGWNKILVLFYIFIKVIFSSFEQILTHFWKCLFYRLLLNWQGREFWIADDFRSVFWRQHFTDLQQIRNLISFPSPAFVCYRFYSLSLSGAFKVFSFSSGYNFRMYWVLSSVF